VKIYRICEKFPASSLSGVIILHRANACILVTRGHFRSCDKDDSRAIWSAVAENPMLRAKLVALCFIEAKLWPIEVLNWGNIHFGCFLLLWPWPWLHDLYIWTWPRLYGDIPDVWKWTSCVKSFESYHITSCECVHLLMRGHFRCKYELPILGLSKVVFWQTYIQTLTDRHDRNYIPCHLMGGQLSM